MSQITKSCCFPWYLKLLLLGWMGGWGLLAGCQGGKGDAAPPTVRIGVALYQQEDTFIAAIAQGMERLAREEEVNRGLKINLNVMDGQGNQTVQMEQIERMMNGGCDILCVNLVDRTEASIIVDRAKEAEIPVIFFNRQPVEEDLKRWDQAYYVGAKGEESGRFQGEMVWKLWEEAPERVDRNGDGVLQYVMLEGEPGHQDALLRTEYAVKTLTDQGVEVEKLASHSANWNRGQANARMTLWYGEFGAQIEVIFANNDDMALGAVDALFELGVPEDQLPIIVGVDGIPEALEAIRLGQLHGTVGNAWNMPEVLLEMGLTLYEKGELPPLWVEQEHYIWLSYQPITPEDLTTLSNYQE